MKAIGCHLPSPATCGFFAMRNPKIEGFGSFLVRWKRWLPLEEGHFLRGLLTQSKRDTSSHLGWVTANLVWIGYLSYLDKLFYLNGEKPSLKCLFRVPDNACNANFKKVLALNLPGRLLKKTAMFGWHAWRRTQQKTFRKWERIKWEKTPRGFGIPT